MPDDQAHLFSAELREAKDSIHFCVAEAKSKSDAERDSQR